MQPCLLRPPERGDWSHIAMLLAESIPNALASHLGPRFGTLYYRHLGERPEARSFAAYDATGTLAGVVIGTLDWKRSRRLSLPLTLQLLGATHIRVLSPPFLRWLANTHRTSTAPRAEMAAASRPKAELLAIAVDPRFRGQRLAFRLLAQMESAFRETGLTQTYLVRTEQENHAANRLYAQAGAHLDSTHLYHGRTINIWHKSLN